MRYLIDQSILWTPLCLLCGVMAATNQTGNLRKIPGLRVTSRTQQMRIPKEGSLPLVEKEDARIMERKENGQKDNYKPGTEAFSMLKCNSSVSVRHGHIATPNYPQAYSANQQCDYHIVLPDQQSRIQFRFLHLGLERGHDWIKIDAGNYQEMFTGSDLPSSLIVTSQNTATLSFHSDEDIEETGFLIQFDALNTGDLLELKRGIKKDLPVGPASKSPNSQGAETAVCGGVFVAEAGFISTPNFPENYTNHLKCQWIIKGPAHSMINLTAYSGSFGTEAEHDQLLIYASSDTSSSPLDRPKNMTLLKSLSGHLSSPSVNIIGPTSTMLLQFWTDKSQSEMGFKLQYSIIQQNISKTEIWATSGVLQSACYPADYPINQRTTWIIHGSPRGSNIRIMDLELDKDAKDHLLIARGDNLQDGIICSLLGSLDDLSSALVSIANSTTFIVHFASHYHNRSRRGWIISYEPRPDLTLPTSQHDATLPELDVIRSLSQGKNVRRLPDYQQVTGPIDDMAYSASSYAVRGAGTFSTLPIMEIEVEPFHPQQDWQGDLKECLCSMLPRSILRHQRRPAIKTTVLHWGEGDIVRVMITTAEGTDDLVHQLRSALSTGKVRCNDTLEMYLPDLIRDVQSKMTGQNWLLASICIIAFFVITFSALLFIHCKQRRVVIRKKKPTSAQLSTMASNKGPMINVVMEPSIQRNPLYEIKRPASKSNAPSDSTGLTDKTSLKKCPSTSSSNEPTQEKCHETTVDDGFDYPAPTNNTRMYPQVCRSKSMGGTVISQNIPSLTQGYNRKLDIILEPNDEETVSVKSISATSDHSDDCCQLDADMGEIVEVSCEALAPESYASLMDEWRNGRPMTVRAVKQKSHFKKQMKKDGFDVAKEQTASDPSLV